MIAEAAVMEGPAGVGAALDLDRIASTPEADLPLAGAKPGSGSPEAGLPPVKGRGVADSATATEKMEKVKWSRVPSSRNREVYRQVKILERSERDVAREFGLSQPRVSAICKQVRLWNEENGGNRPDQTPQASHNLAVANARLRLSHTFSQAAKWLEVGGQPSQTERIKAGEETGDVVKKGPNPKPAFVGHMLRAAIELAKLEGAYDRIGPQPLRPESPPVSTGYCDFEQSPLARFDSPSVACEQVLSPQGAELAYERAIPIDDPVAKQWQAEGWSKKDILEVRRRKQLKTPNNCYRAVAEAHAPPGDSDAADRLEDYLIDLEIMAEKADALAWYRVLRQPPPIEPLRKLPDEGLRPLLEEYRRDTLEMLLARDSELDLTNESYHVVLARYQPETGRFDWRRDTGKRDLASLLVPAWELEETDEAAGEEGEQACCAPDSEPVDPQPCQSH